MCYLSGISFMWRTIVKRAAPLGADLFAVGDSTGKCTDGPALEAAESGHSAAWDHSLLQARKIVAKTCICCRKQSHKAAGFSPRAVLVYFTSCGKCHMIACERHVGMCQVQKRRRRKGQSVFLRLACIAPQCPDRQSLKSVDTDVSCRQK